MDNKIDVLVYELLANEQPSNRFVHVRTRGIINNKIVAEKVKEKASEFDLDKLQDVLDLADQIRLKYLLNGFVVNSGFANAKLVDNRILKDEVFDPCEANLKMSYNMPFCVKKQIKNVEVNLLQDDPDGISIRVDKDDL